MILLPSIFIFLPSTPISEPVKYTFPNLVSPARKGCIVSSLASNEFSEARTFLRKTLNIDNIYHHIGIYCYSVDTLEKFVKLRQSQNEIKNRLEQLRAIDNNINIKVALAKSSPIGVDTKEDYLALKKIMEYKV